MSQEVKVRYADVENAISKIESALVSFDTPLMKELASANTLDVVENINKLNNSLEEVRETYKQLLKSNNQAMGMTLKSIKDADNKLSQEIKAPSEGKKL